MLGAGLLVASMASGTTGDCCSSLGVRILAICVAYDLPGRGVFWVSGSRPGLWCCRRLLPEFKEVGFRILVLPLGLRILDLPQIG